MTFFDKVYVINLKHRVDKLNDFKEEIKKCFTDYNPKSDEEWEIIKLFENFTLIEGVNGKECADDLIKDGSVKILENYRDPYYGRYITKGEIGCTLGHIKVWNNMVTNQVKRGLILEDDVVFKDGFIKDLIEYMGQLNKLDWEFVYFGRKPMRKNEEHIDENICKAKFSWWTLSYGMTLSCAKKFISSNVINNILPSDEFIPIMFNGHENTEWCASFKDSEKVVGYAFVPRIIVPRKNIWGSSDTEISKIATLQDRSLNKYGNRIFFYTVGSDMNDCCKRYVESCAYYGIPYKILGLGKPWKGGFMAQGQGGGAKVVYLREELMKLTFKDNDIICFTDCYDVIFNNNPNYILERFLRSKCDILFGAECYIWPDKSLASDYPKVKSKYKFLNSGGFIAYANKFKEMISDVNIKHSADDQLYYTRLYLKSLKNCDLNIKLDHKCLIFQNLSGMHNDIDIHLESSSLINKTYNTRPCIVHGNGGISCKNFFNTITNYIPFYSNVYGNIKFKRDQKTRGDNFTIMIATLVKNRGDTIGKCIENICDLSYPKERVLLYINISKSDDNTEDIVDEYINKLYEFQDIIIIKNDISVSQAQELMLKEARKQKVDYLFVVDSDIILENRESLQTLINQDKTLIAPMLTKKKIPFWSNFWGDIDDKFFYKRITEPYFNYFDIVNRKKKGMWNVPLVHSCYLLNIKDSQKLSYLGKYGDYGYRNLAYHCISRFIFMSVLNSEHFGYICE
jgi:GR25 family glycosyltransferase involved in LPS biosynthesis